MTLPDYSGKFCTAYSRNYQTHCSKVRERNRREIFIEEERSTLKELSSTRYQKYYRQQSKAQLAMVSLIADHHTSSIAEIYCLEYVTLHVSDLPK
jgi:hypothetical protein